MAGRVTHAKVTGKPAGLDATKVYGSDWDADHIITGLTIGQDVQAYDATLSAISGKTTTGSGNIVLSASPTFTGTVNGASATFSGTLSFGVGTITSLPIKGSPNTTNDYIPIYDAAGNAVARTTVGAVSAGGAVASVNGATGSITLSAMGSIFNLGLTATVAANALTVAIKDASGADPSATSPVVISFRNATVSTGTPSALSVSAAASLTVSSGSTLGASNNTPFHLLVVGFNDAGTFRLGIINASASGVIYPCPATGIASSTAEGGAGAADSAGVFYTGTAVSSKAYVVLARLSWTATPLATAGTWANGPDRIELVHANFKYPGELVQSLVTGDSVNTTGTTVIPIDDTIPQNTEGTQFYSQAITPTSQANWLNVEAHLQVGSTSAIWILAGLFQDSTANALQSTGQNITGGYWVPLDMNATMLANTVSSTTFKVRAGPATAATVGVNGIGATRELGGTLYSYIKVSEYQG